MTLHREGYIIMTVGLLILSLIQVGNYFLLTETGWMWLFLLLTMGVLVMAYLTESKRLDHMLCAVLITRALAA